MLCDSLMQPARQPGDNIDKINKNVAIKVQRLPAAGGERKSFKLLWPRKRKKKSKAVETVRDFLVKTRRSWVSSRFDLRNGQNLRENLHTASHECNHYVHVLPTLPRRYHPFPIHTTPKWSATQKYPPSHVFECADFSSRVTSRVKWNRRHRPLLSVTSANLMWVVDPSNDDSFLTINIFFIKKFVISNVAHGKSSVWVPFRWRMCWRRKCRSFNESVCYCLR